ncbi:MAG: iron-containing alcohol dehydrogenase [Polyangiales bacterium]
MTVVWTFPTRILFGAGAAREAGAEAKPFGASRALLVTDESVEATGHTTLVVESLARAGITTAIFDQVSSNPLETEVLAAADAYRHADASLLVAVGGGSVIDVAKLTRIAVSHPLPLAPYGARKNGEAKLVGNLPPLLAVPTTAGSGSEVMGTAHVTIQSTHRKTLFASPKLLPTVAILDPSLTVSLPPRLTAASGMSALARCIEAYQAPGDHPMADAIALNGIAQLLSAFERAVLDGGDVDARGTMLKASMMGAVAAQKGLGLSDAIAHALTVEAGVHHGLASAVALPHVLDYNRSAVQDKIAKLARLFGARGTDTETLAFECAGAVRSLRKKVGLPDSLPALGIDEKRIERIATVALEDPSRDTNPRAATLEDVVSLLQAAL